MSKSQAEYHQIAEVQTDAATERLFNNHARDNVDTHRSDLAKRSASLAVRGLAALETLLTGATKYRTNKQARFYRKRGNRQTALADFNAVQPVLTRQNPNALRVRQGKRPGQVFIGTAGDRRLILMLGGDKNSGYSPVLEIRTATDHLFDRIIYKIDK